MNQCTALLSTHPLNCEFTFEKGVGFYPWRLTLLLAPCPAPPDL
jgi:hypothetical protein